MRLNPQRTAITRESVTSQSDDRVCVFDSRDKRPDSHTTKLQSRIIHSGLVSPKFNGDTLRFKV